MDIFAVLSAVVFIISYSAVVLGTPPSVTSIGFVMAPWDSLLKWMGMRKEEEKEGEEKPPQNMNEVIDRLPKSYHDYAAQELPYRRASAMAFIVLCLICGFPLWWHTTQVYRAPMGTVAEKGKIPLEVRVKMIATKEQMRSHLPLLEEKVLEKVNEGDTPASLSVQWKVEYGEVIPLSSLLSSDSPASTGLDVNIVLVSPEEWTHFSVNYAYLSCSDLIYIQMGEDIQKVGHRIGSLLWEVLIDVPHLESIVKRDLRERMAPWQIATLPLSHQKRLVWDSAALSGDYIVQIVFLHNNKKLNGEEKKRSINTVDNFWRFAHLIKNVTRLQISSEHLWDFEIDNYLEKDVQERMTLTEGRLQDILKEVDMQLQTVESAAPVLKMVVLETEVPVIILDHTKEDSHGAAVASWGAVVSRDGKTDARLMGALRVLLGLDSDLVGGRLREECPLSAWEITRLRLRAFVDNSLRAASAIRALHKMKDSVDNLVISDDVASLVNSALSLLTHSSSDAHTPRLEMVAEAREKADYALSHPSLLALLYFPTDQKVAVYLPIMVPTLIPLFGSIYALFKWAIGRG